MEEKDLLVMMENFMNTVFDVTHRPDFKDNGSRAIEILYSLGSYTAGYKRIYEHLKSTQVE